MSALTDALQRALAAEHAAVFGYGLLGPSLTGDDQHRAVVDSDAHETVRDTLTERIAAAGTTPVGPAADYPAFARPADLEAARRLAVRLEDDCTAAWRFVYATVAAGGATSRALRADARAQLTAAALRAVAWRATVTPATATVAFPGI